MSSLNSLNAASEDRKARLAKLRGLKRKQPTEDVAPEPEQQQSDQPLEPEQQAEPDVARQYLSGRNYDFETRGPKLGFESMPNKGLERPTLEEQAADVAADVEKRAAQEAQDDKGIDLLKLQPKKPNWDLKRNLEKKMGILNVRTDNAIANLVRQRIASSQKGGDAYARPTEGEPAEVDGLALVEGLRIREKEGEGEERRERDEDEALMMGE
ncbi:hypothetical protein L249_1436 [Ophiocordyceps polyrhachis-furcata BCC 54312]|uniref:Cwf18 pre-mRNA splicing factor n=1 Tax=Ophiocordyceps polyrhachis-furcata BCC 54312 TaxID=1330021 RepID=A0A367L4H5_9HYPO|nr:hypothetical protein L249_1436 [Ophiocordyceps polyrhachis-furcata BCC 54312]